MAVPVAVVIGALVGLLYARRKGGTNFDQAHHAAVGAIICGTLAVLVLIVIARMS